MWQELGKQLLGVVFGSEMEVCGRMGPEATYFKSEKNKLRSRKKVTPSSLILISIVK